MSVLALLGSWFILSLIISPIIGTMIRDNSNPLDEDNINN